MKRILFSLLVLFLLLGLAACSKDGGKEELTEIDAVKVSEQIVPLKYAVEIPEQSGSVWIDDALALFGDRVCYTGSDSEGACLFAYDPQSALSQVICSFPDQMLRDLAVSPEGQIYVLALPLDESHAGAVIEIDAEGRQTGSYMLDALDMGEDSSVREIRYAEGVLYLLSNEQLTAAKLGETFRKIFSLDVEPGAKMTVTGDGQLILGQLKDGKYRLYRLDSKKQTLEAAAAFNLSFSRIAAGQSWDLYLDDGSCLYGYRFADRTLEKLFSWTGLSITGGAVVETENSKLICTGKISFDKPTPLLTLAPKEADTAEGSTILLATTSEYGLDYRIQEAIREWNTENPDHPIEVVRYSVFDDGSDPRAARMRLAADIAAGKIPDIYDFSMVSIDTIPSSGQFARRGLLEDLYPYIDKDPELSREDFFSGVLRSLEISGGLYELVPEYSLTTSFAYSGAVGEASSWTYANFNDVVSQSPYVETLFDNHYGRAFWLGNVIAASGEKLVNWETGECYFDSDYFKNVLETAKTVPEEGLPHAYSTLNTDVQNSTSLLYYCNIGDIWMASIAPSAFGENYCFVGFPEIGNVIYPSLSFGISSFSANKEECWAFLRQFVTREYNTQFFLSPRRDGMQGQIDRAWKEVVEDGNDRIHPYGLEAMNEIAAIIENASLAARHDPQIWQIVWPEASAYFAGQRSLEDTVDLIQSRASIYMAEQS